jgi:hypothetical protein
MPPLSIPIVLRALTRRPTRQYLPDRNMPITTAAQLQSRAHRRAIHISPARPASSADPDANPKGGTPHTASQGAKKAPISIDTFHARADAFIDQLVTKLEDLQEEREDVDVEYSVRQPSTRASAPRLPSLPACTSLLSLLEPAC